jgi:hypothetical protein
MQTFLRWYPYIAAASQGHNYYVKAFSGMENPTTADVLAEPDKQGRTPRFKVDLLHTYRKFKPWRKKVPWEDFEKAVDALRRFNLVLILELTDAADPLVQGALGWQAPARQVRPHEKEAHRADKSSHRAREALEPAVYDFFAAANAFDLLLYHCARMGSMLCEGPPCRIWLLLLRGLQQLITALNWWGLRPWQTSS